MNMKYRKVQITGLALALTMVMQPALAEVTHRQPNEHNTITFVSNEAWQPEDFVNGTTIPASYINDTVITLDGKEQELAWAGALEVNVPLSYGKIEQASLKALYSDDEVFIRVRWADASPDREHHPWVWDETSQAYVASPQVEDSVMLSFEAGCEWTPSLLGGYMYDFDAWHWLAARSDPLGQAVDLYGNVQDRAMRNPDFYRFESRVREDDWVMKFTENHDVDFNAAWDELDRVYMKQPVTPVLYLRAVPDGGPNYPSFARQLPAPTGIPSDKAQTFPQYSPLKLEGGAGEVGAKGHWQDGYWTVEFRRIRLTPARAIFDTLFNRLVQFSVHVFDQTEAIDEASESGRLFLRFLPDDLDEEQLLVKE
jgi:hypothetical protein